jgi:hypothetical protein
MAKNPSTTEVREYNERCKLLGVEPQSITDEFGNVLPDVFGHGEELKQLILDSQKKSREAKSAK